MGPEWIDKFRLGSEVKRFHTQPTTRQCTNGHHSLNAIAIAMYLMEESGRTSPSDKLQVMHELMIHDIPEMHTGDIPGPVKAHPEMNIVASNLEADWFMDNMPGYMIPTLDDPDLIAIVKMADKIELMWWCVEEKEMGNSRITSVYNTVLSMIIRAKPVEGAPTIVNYLTQRWRKTL